MKIIIALLIACVVVSCASREDTYWAGVAQGTGKVIHNGM